MQLSSALVVEYFVSVRDGGHEQTGVTLVNYFGVEPAADAPSLPFLASLMATGGVPSSEANADAKEKKKKTVPQSRRLNSFG